ncbi:amino acid adenylation domain-containing protein, partial [Lysinibacillus sphaericus]
NGKVDRNNLPEPTETIDDETNYMAPRTDIEKQLVEIWSDVLHVNKIGIHDNFFNIGGDSIKSIQISSKLNEIGLKISLKDIFNNPTIEKLALNIKANQQIIKQDEVSGDVFLSPIQSWFFNNKFTNPHHFNQSILLYSNKGYNTANLIKAFEEVIKHHDALRIIVNKEENKTSLFNRKISEGKLFNFYEYYSSNNDVIDTIKKNASQIQSSIDLENGPLINLCIFKTHAGDFLLIVIHHLIVDGVSWRIILEDLFSAYDSLSNHLEISFPDKTSSFQEWTKRLKDYANNNFSDEISYWTEISSNSKSLENFPFGTNKQNSIRKHNQRYSIQVSEKNTELLLKKVNKFFKTTLNEILLAILSKSIYEVWKQERILINIEGHGREEISSDLNIQRTVGWFTSIFPIILNGNTTNMLHHITLTKEQLRNIPKKGFNYGIIKYLKDKKSNLNCNPKISFNYLGDFSNLNNELKNKWENIDVSISDIFKGYDLSQDSLNLYTLDITSLIIEGKLNINFEYDKAVLSKKEVKDLINIYNDNLLYVINYCTNQYQIEENDFYYDKLTREDLEEVKNKYKHISALENIYPLTPMQKGMLFHYLYNKDSLSYLEQHTFEINSDINIRILQESFNLIFNKHQIFRTSFIETKDNIHLQVVLKNRPIYLKFEDITHLDKNSQNSFIQYKLTENNNYKFDLFEDALLKISLFKKEQAKYLLVFSFHHILLDGWSLPIFFKELSNNYFALLNNKQITNSVVPYSSFIEWLDEKDHNRTENYWENYLVNYSNAENLTNKYGMLDNNQYLSEEKEISLAWKQSSILKNLAKSMNVTLSSLFHTAWSVLLSKFLLNDDVMFGTVVSGRSSEIKQVGEIIGLLINTVPVRTKLDKNSSFIEQVKRHHSEAIDKSEHDYYPLYDLQSKILNNNVKIDHVLIFENYPLNNSKTNVENSFDFIYKGGQEQTNYNLNIIVIPEDEIKVKFSYNCFVFNTSFIETIMNAFVQILIQIGNDPTLLIKEIEIIGNNEREVILKNFNKPILKTNSNETILDLFAKQILIGPNNIAISYKTESISYKELDEMSTRIASLLISEGAKKGSKIALSMEKTPYLISGILAILKIGAIYIPIDPKNPIIRKQSILKDSHAEFYLTSQKYYDNSLFINKIKTVILDINDFNAEKGLQFNNISPSDVAYILYTSGTTGTPKGVIVEHGNLLNLINNQINLFQITKKDKVLQFCSIGFDVSISEIFMTLSAGATLVLEETEVLMENSRIIDKINNEKISILAIPSSSLSHLEPTILPSLRLILAGGDMCTSKLIRDWKTDYTNLINSYGPTETTVTATLSNCEYDIVNPHVGKPLSNVNVYILNQDKQLLPIGIPGELYISGAGVARGYLNQPEMTAEKFLPDPFNPGERMYKTGDLAKWLPDGNIEYLGRIDNQVKIRGYRIELDEIESRLTRISQIKEAVVTAPKDAMGTRYLCAYVVSDKKLHVAELKVELGQVLPSYMIPTRFIQLEKLPLTTNGKVDRKNLPEPTETIDDETNYMAPRTDIEKQLVEIWSDVLQIRKIGILDNFFEVGGHSLKATILTSRISKNLHVSITLQEIFENPTIKSISQIIEKKVKEHYMPILPVKEQDYYAASSAQKR